MLNLDATEEQLTQEIDVTDEYKIKQAKALLDVTLNRSQSSY